ncbi:MAG: hypothetical protein ACM3NZ_11480, partial [Betaproteobacteria bacterium]
RADEHALERLGEATTLERVAAGTGAFGHAGLRSKSRRLREALIIRRKSLPPAFGARAFRGAA